MQDPAAHETPPTFPLSRRVKTVISREVVPGLPGPAGDDAVGQAITIGGATPATVHVPADAEAAAAGAIDPTPALGHRRRRRTHHRRYRLAQGTFVLSILLTAGGMACLAFEDLPSARIAAALAIVAALACVVAAWKDGVPRRALGMGLAGSVLAGMAVLLAFVAPEHWFAESSPERQGQENLTPTPKRVSPR